MTDLATLAEAIDWPDHDGARAVRERRGRLTAPAGSLGELETFAEWLCGVQGRYPARDFARARLLVFVADHGVAAAGVSRFAPDATDDLVAQATSAGGVLAVLADDAHVGIRIVQAGDDGTGRRRRSGRIDREAALTAQQVIDAVAAGAALADDEVDSGTDLLMVGTIGVASTTVAAALIATITATEPAKTIGVGGSRIDDDRWMTKAAVVRDARRRAWPWRNDPMDLLAATGGADIATLAGFLLQAAVRRTPVVIDGVVATAAALTANQAQPRAARWWRAAQRTSEPAQQIALTALGLTPLIELNVSSGDGTGALLALPLLRAAVLTVTDAGALPPADPEPVPDAGSNESPVPDGSADV